MIANVLTFLVSPFTIRGVVNPARQYSAVLSQGRWILSGVNDEHKAKAVARCDGGFDRHR